MLDKVWWTGESPEGDPETREQCALRSGASPEVAGRCRALDARLEERRPTAWQPWPWSFTQHPPRITPPPLP